MPSVLIVQKFFSCRAILVLFLSLIVSVNVPVAAAAPVLCQDVFKFNKVRPVHIPPLSELWVVHATNYFLQDGFLQPNGSQVYAFRPTLHFSIGGLVRAHAHGKWEEKKYAVLLPMTVIKSQIINSYPQDVVVWGGVKLLRGAIVFVPQSEEAPALDGIQFIRYPYGGLREAIDRVIKIKGGWRSAIDPASHEPLLVKDGDSILESEFRFADGDAQTWNIENHQTVTGQLDIVMVSIFLKPLLISTQRRLSDSEVVELRDWVQAAILQAETIHARLAHVHQRWIHEGAQPGLDNAQAFLKLLDFEVWLRKTKGQSVLNNQLNPLTNPLRLQHLHDLILQGESKEALLRSLHESGEELEPSIKDSKKTDPLIEFIRKM